MQLTSKTLLLGLTLSVLPLSGTAVVPVAADQQVTEKQQTQDILAPNLIYSLPGVRMIQRFKVSHPQAKVSVTGLPKGLTYNAKRQRIEGVVNTEGIYNINIIARVGRTTVAHKMTLEVSSNLVSPTPFMGWMTWNSFEGDINEQNMREIADAMVSTGLRDAGYNYLCIDDLWHAPVRKKNGHLGFDTEKFPNGLNALTDYVHKLGLKIGIYSDAADFTCAGAPGSLGYEETDAKQYAAWGFDFLKYDYCGAPAHADTAFARYARMGKALKATGRPFYYDICEWGVLEPWKWADKAGGHSWRITYDSRDTWDHGGYGGSNCGVTQAIDIAKPLYMYGGPNRFNDMDMIMTGLYGKGKSSSHNKANGMTDREYQAQFTMWSILASPLVPVLDLRAMNDETKRILTNKEVIAVNQDRMGQQAECISDANGLEVYVKELENGDVAVAFLNRTDRAEKMSTTLKALFLSGTYIVRDLWLHKDIATTKHVIEAEVQSHEARIFRLRKA